jgi:hypothetical protein
MRLWILAFLIVTSMSAAFSQSQPKWEYATWQAGAYMGAAQTLIAEGLPLLEPDLGKESGRGDTIFVGYPNISNLTGSDFADPPPDFLAGLPAERVTYFPYFMRPERKPANLVGISIFRASSIDTVWMGLAVTYEPHFDPASEPKGAVRLKRPWKSGAFVLVRSQNKWEILNWYREPPR